jgi:hypothetical protein
MPKYKAEPAPVRMTEGVVPRHNDRIGEGPASMFLSARESDALEDC